MPKETFNCDQCGNQFVRWLIQVRGKNKFCSHNCRYEFQKTSLLGEKNPNFNKRWSKKRRKTWSKRLKEIYVERPELKEVAGSANRGQKFSKERCNKMADAARTGNTGKHQVSAEAKIKIGIASKAKWTDEYKTRNRQTREALGIWRKLEDQEDAEIYYKQANWIVRMFDIVESNGLLKKYGVYNTTTNKIGVVRDHKFSRKSGFILKVFPEILRHPANCQIITNAENTSLAQKEYGKHDDVVTLGQLFNDIQNYKLNWLEQEKVINLIHDYKNGKRWKNPYRKEDVT